MRGGCPQWGEPGEVHAGMGSQGCSVPGKLFGTGYAFPQAQGHSDPVKISPVCVV